MSDPRPHDNCYWVEPGRFLAGEYPGDGASESPRSEVRNNEGDKGIYRFL